MLLAVPGDRRSYLGSWHKTSTGDVRSHVGDQAFSVLRRIIVEPHFDGRETLP
jgi:hypothetical protein